MKITLVISQVRPCLEEILSRMNKGMHCRIFLYTYSYIIVHVYILRDIDNDKSEFKRFFLVITYGTEF